MPFGFELTAELECARLDDELERISSKYHKLPRWRFIKRWLLAREFDRVFLELLEIQVIVLNNKRDEHVE